MRACFLDRDGVVVFPVMRDGQPTPPWKLEEVRFAPFLHEALTSIRGLGFLVVLVTNQPDIAYGNVSRREWQSVQSRIEEEVHFDGVFVCFHGRGDICNCKKPKPGLLLDAARELRIDLAGSVVIGDTSADTGAARAAGCRSIIVGAEYNRGVASDYRVANLQEAAELLTGLEGRRT